MGVGKKEIPLLQGNGAQERIGVLPRVSTPARLSLKLTWSDEEGSKEQYSEIEVAHDEHPFAMRVKAETGPAHVQPTRSELPRTMASAHPERPRGHAFISYVREDSDRVARLVEQLEDAGIKVWLDKEDIAPGQDWKAEIRHAITDGALAFVACFSLNSEQRNKSYQNEELLLAAEEIRLRPLGQQWYFPVRFDKCDPPAYDIGAGRTLKSIQHSDLFGKDWERSAKRLVRAIVESQSSSSSTLRLTVPPQPAEVSAMPIRKAAEVLGRLTREQAASILAELSTERSAARLAAMSVPASAEVATFIGEETGADILSAMEPAQAAKLLVAMEQTEAVERIHLFSSQTVLRLLPFIEGRDQKRLLTGRSDDELTRVELQELARSKKGNLFLSADSATRTSLIREADPEVAADWLRIIHIQHAADLLTQIDTGRAAEILWDFDGDELTLWFKVLGARPAGLRILEETGPHAIWSRLTSMNEDQAGAIADGLVCRS